MSPLLDGLMHALNRHGETVGTDVNTTVHRFLDLYGSPAHERHPTLRSRSAPIPVRSHELVLAADLEHAGFMPPILHVVIREGRWPFSATGSGSLPASVGTGLSAEAQLHRCTLIRNTQGGLRSTQERQHCVIYGGNWQHHFSSLACTTDGETAWLGCGNADILQPRVK